MNKLIFIFFLLFYVQAYSSELVIYKHSSGVFELLVPSDWKISHPEGGNNITTFNSNGDSRVDLTISLAENLSLPDVLPERYFEYFFPDEKSISDLKRSEGTNWKSINKNWQGTKDGFKTVWFAELYNSHDNLVAITLSDVNITIAEHTELFQKITKSIRFN